jgi:hypothetical protein
MIWPKSLEGYITRKCSIVNITPGVIHNTQFPLQLTILPPKARVLHYIRPESLVKEKHSSLLGLFLSSEANVVP